MTASAAIDYAGQGWPVVPLWWPWDGRCVCPKGNDCSSPGKHPLTVNGLKDASTNPVQVAAWWERWPSANVGLRTGDVFDVLDLDGPLVGYEFDALITNAGGTPEWDTFGPQVATARGRHLYFKATGLGNRTLIGGLRVDWRGHHGYVVAPPSIHVTGVPYRWIYGEGPDAPLEDVPPGLLKLLTAPKPTPALVVLPRSTVSTLRLPERGKGWSGSGLLDAVRTARVGQRNDRLNWAAYKVGQGVAEYRLSAKDAVRFLEQLHAAAVSVGLGAEEAEATIRSGYKSGTPSAVAS